MSVSINMITPESSLQSRRPYACGQTTLNRVLLTSNTRSASPEAWQHFAEPTGVQNNPFLHIA